MKSVLARSALVFILCLFMALLLHSAVKTIATPFRNAQAPLVTNCGKVSTMEISALGRGMLTHVVKDAKCPA